MERERERDDRRYLHENIELAHLVELIEVLACEREIDNYREGYIEIKKGRGRERGR